MITINGNQQEVSIEQWDAARKAQQIMHESGLAVHLTGFVIISNGHPEKVSMEMLPVKTSEIAAAV